MKKKTISCILMLLSLFAHSAAQVVATIGPNELKRTQAMNEAVIFISSIGEVITHRDIGGISFEKVATPSDSGISKQKIIIRYLPGNADRHRLQVIFGNGQDSTYYPDIPDWQLRPIAEFSNGINTAVFSYYNNNTNQVNRVVRYHPAFMDGLLGYRMFQADLIFWGPQMSGLPVAKNTGRLIIAESEKRFKLDTVTPLFPELVNKKRELYQNANSYIITDWGRSIMFGVAKDSFYISGEPYYLFTNQIKDSIPLIYSLKENLSKLGDEAPFRSDPDYKKITDFTKQSHLSASEKGQITKLLNQLSDRYGYPYDNWFRNTTYAVGYYSDTALIKKLQKDLYTWENIFSDPYFLSLKKLACDGNFTWTISEVNGHLNALWAKYNSSAGDWVCNKLDSSWRNSLYYELPSKIALLIRDSYTTNQFNKMVFEFNPVVFNSCIVTARYAAFFRYVKAKNPVAWEQFITAIRNNRPAQTDFADEIKTPHTIQ